MRLAKPCNNHHYTCSCESIRSPERALFSANFHKQSGSWRAVSFFMGALQEIFIFEWTAWKCCLHIEHEHHTSQAHGQLWSCSLGELFRSLEICHYIHCFFGHSSPYWCEAIIIQWALLVFIHSSPHTSSMSHTRLSLSQNVLLPIINIW